MPLVSAPSINSRFTQLLIAAAFLVVVGWFLVPAFDLHRHLSNVPGIGTPEPKPPVIQLKPDHPIDHLVREAEVKLNALLNKETTDIHNAAQAYRDRRGRQPPPGFDIWFQFAQNNSALIVEDFFDQIYHDLNPFWGVPAKQMREQTRDYIFRISIRKGNAGQHGDGQDRPWLTLWQNLTQTIAHYLPDVDLPINEMDESRMVVPWEDINGFMEKEHKTRRVVPEDQLKDKFQSLAELDTQTLENFDPEYIREGHYWTVASVGCAPGSEARKAYIETDFTPPPPLTTAFPIGSYEGYVQNWTLATSPCDNSNLQGLHGTFVEPISMATTKKFFPLFGGSKLPMNNEILLPPAMYWTHDPFYSGGEDHGEAWRKKNDVMIWRGAASGGRNKKENWTRFQRHRFVSMVNATSVLAAEAGSEEQPPNFVIPANNSYELAAQSPDAEPGALSEWIESWSNVAVVHLLCFPPEPGPPPNNKFCPYTDPYFRIGETKPMSDQYAYKYLPDIDGNSFSGRYRGFLGSTSLPIKATIYQEWHDSRLVPWKHFVPMDNTFIDIYGIMEYFVGNKDAGVEGHDDVAKDIAIGGKRWAERVLRREDMQIYVLRLLLEYARLCDDDRDVMGWRDSGVHNSGVT